MPLLCSENTGPSKAKAGLSQPHRSPREGSAFAVPVSMAAGLQTKVPGVPVNGSQRALAGFPLGKLQCRAEAGERGLVRITLWGLRWWSGKTAESPKCCCWRAAAASRQLMHRNWIDASEWKGKKETLPQVNQKAELQRRTKLKPASSSRGQKRRKVCPLVATTSIQDLSSSSTVFQGIKQKHSSCIFPRAVCLLATHSALYKQHALCTQCLAAICRSSPHVTKHFIPKFHIPISFKLLLCIKAHSGWQLQPHPSPPCGLWACWLNMLTGLMITPLFQCSMKWLNIPVKTPNLWKKSLKFFRS